MKDKLEIRFQELKGILLSEMNEEAFWRGRLSSSALGVAVAVAALHFHNAVENEVEIQKGLDWLKNNINEDGSYGDTPESPGNVSTSLLVYSAINLYVDKDDSLVRTQERLSIYLQKCDINLYSDEVADTILAHYKKDYTFSVPILTMCALCGIPEKNGFEKIPQLPFELALLPQKFYRLLNLSVVSYAVPALIAVGIVIFKNKKSGRVSRWIRGKAQKKALQILQKLLPESGGFLEAIPLTAFVALSLINAGYSDSEVVKAGISFLKRTQRDDGGFPIDVDLSTWVTSLSIKALGNDKIDDVLDRAQQEALAKHYIQIQNKQIHPFNGTSPGGWGWTNFSGSVPDCDDTPGAILSLLLLSKGDDFRDEILQGGEWLLKLQNSDGGFPTFSRGWGKLPFDQSCADLTGHCFLALVKILERYGQESSTALTKKYEAAIFRSLGYLEKHQQKNGSWLPLWFGNQYTQKHENPVYGTARVLTYLNDALPCLVGMAKVSRVQQLIDSGQTFLVNVQNKDGSWGGDKNITGTIEETALAVSALSDEKYSSKCAAGLNWLDEYFQQNGLKSAPIGLYFASLWYDEKMYPLTSYLEALRRNLEK